MVEKSQSSARSAKTGAASFRRGARARMKDKSITVVSRDERRGKTDWAAVDAERREIEAAVRDPDAVPLDIIGQRSSSFRREKAISIRLTGTCSIISSRAPASAAHECGATLLYAAKRGSGYDARFIRLLMMPRPILALLAFDLAPASRPQRWRARRPQRQDRHHRFELRPRRQPHDLCATFCAASGRAPAGPAHGHHAQHAGRRRSQRHQLPLQRGGARRHRAGRHPPDGGDRTGAGRGRRQIRRAPLQLDRARQLERRGRADLAYGRGQDDRGCPHQEPSWPEPGRNRPRSCFRASSTTCSG